MTGSTVCKRTDEGSKPRSWAEDLNTYRQNFGSRAFKSTGEPPKRYGRTTLVPLGAVDHPQFSYGDKGPDPAPTAPERFGRHGWGDDGLLKYGWPGVHPRAHEIPSGKIRPPSPRGADGRGGLFGTLQIKRRCHRRSSGSAAEGMQMTERGAMDSWVGNHLISPSCGKKATTGPAHPTRFFTVINQSCPGKPSDDSWMGNRLVDPARGKARPEGPEERLGRKDLFSILQQDIVQELGRKAPCTPSKDPLSDAWIGNNFGRKDPIFGQGIESYSLPPPKILPLCSSTGSCGSTGRAPEPPAGIPQPSGCTKTSAVVSGSCGFCQSTWNPVFTPTPLSDPGATLWEVRLIHPEKGRLPGAAAPIEEQQNLSGAVLRGHVPDTDFGPLGKRTVDYSLCPFQNTTDSMKPHSIGPKKGLLVEVQHKRHVQPTATAKLDGRTGGDLKPLMQQQSISPSEQAAWQQSGVWNDSGLSRKRAVDVPGRLHPSTGRDMLYWKPKEQIAYFVPFGSLMKEQFNAFKATPPARCHAARGPWK